ncbi:hypothetical protein R0135_15280 [Congregibacter variabilis]|uniref:ATP synthase subunit b n=1 Tax=Congregibacter variabilis TaxID=3081200 RepID=A0ABZ0I1T7_9GAMM|nr:hypothetical protein R0135_15280 [Congregibacter sp. IMCC43200]
MQVDWLTASAQIINFFVLVWLLKHFLYGPVLSAIDQREANIAHQLGDALNREHAADEIQQEYMTKVEALDAERQSLVEQAREAAEAEHQKMLETVRQEVAQKRSQWQRQVADEEREFLSDLTGLCADSVQAIAREALAEIADAQLEAQIIESFIRKLAQLDEEVCASIASCGQALVVTTSFKLDSAARDRLMIVLRERLGEELTVDYRLARDLLCGIELSVPGHRLGWSLAEYLQDLRQRVEEQLDSMRGYS